MNHIVKIGSVGVLFIALLLSIIGNTYVDNVSFSNSPEVGYSSLSPFGERGGRSIPASCESGYSHAGECYLVGEGVKDISTGILGDPPSIPTGPGPIVPTPQCPCSSGGNSCGMTNAGFGACGASCPIPPPEDNLCFPSIITIGTSGSGSSGGSGGTPSVSGKNEQLVAKGGSCNIVWNATPATSCRITAPGVSVSVGVSGVYKTPPISKTTLFTITCMNGNVVSTSKTFNCRLNPLYQETDSTGTR